MLKAVFEYTRASNTAKGRMDRILPQMVDELNRPQDDKPMYIHYNLDTRARLEHFFAQCYVEVAGHTFQLSENLNYSVRGLVYTFKYYRSNKDRIKEAFNDGRAKELDDYDMKKILNSAKKDTIKAIEDLVQEHINTCEKCQTEGDFIRTAQKVANCIVGKRGNKGAQIQTWVNKVYADENRDDEHKLGNTQQGDGYNFRGRGIIQLTGRNNYTEFQSYYNKHNPNDPKDFLNNEEHRKELITNGKIALLGAVYFWNRTEIYKLADTHNDNNINSKVREITKKVNGGTNHLQDRQEAFKRIRFGSNDAAKMDINNGIFKDF